MDDIGLGQAILLALLIYSAVSLVLTSLGSFGLYRLLAAKNNPAAGWIALGASVLILVIAFFALQNPGTMLVALLCYAVFGVTSAVLSRRGASAPPPSNR